MAINEANMKEYYQHVYPLEDVVEWVSYAGTQPEGAAKSYLARREFCFTLLGDIFTRHRSYDSVDLLRKELVSKFPEKIDVGAIYNVAPDMKKTTSILPLERELVFDIDMSDYDSVRSCCKGKKICNFCWPWMSSAAMALRKICKEDFGFKHMMPVFSGRRGIHLWVCDKKARRMSDEERAAVVGYMTVVEGGEFKTNVTFDLLRKESVIHPTMEEVHSSVLVPGFNRIFLENPDSPNHLSQAAPAQIVFRALSAIAGQSWDQRVKQEVAKLAPAEGEGLDWAAVERKVSPGVIKAAQFALLYPRLDEHVSTRRDHLLKLPFCVHPGTSKLCVPLMWDTLTGFQPTEDPPKLDTLLNNRSIETKWKRPLVNMLADMRDDEEEQNQAQ